ncbi:hypothetical protein CMV_022384 [Castanea mollissima]|uniref:Uncharacterized protein n=1 Tax=Castanea mollissima TaxID=60419 RepID=A0A8J4QDY8_9ROSI|nr:hypothetical protein CMV_022384 [Castanea mollissima]
MDPVNGELVGEADVDPEADEGEVSEREDEEEGREVSLAGGEEVLGAVAIEVVDLGADVHGDGGFRSAVGEEEGVLVGGGDRVGAGEGGVWRRGEVAEGEEERDVVGVEDAELRVLLDLEEDLEEGLFGEEEEAEEGRVGAGVRGGDGDGDGGNGDGDVAGVGEAEFLEEDHGAGVGDDGEGFDLGGGRVEEEEEGKGEDGEEEEGCFRHFCLGLVVSQFGVVSGGESRRDWRMEEEI